MAQAQTKVIRVETKVQGVSTDEDLWIKGAKVHGMGTNEGP